jgi:hypothetical protein
LGSHDESALQVADAVRPGSALDESAGAAPLALPQVQIKPPWHVRHARALVAGTGVAVAAAVTYAAFYAWQLATDPFEKLIAERSRPVAGPISAPAPVPAAAAPKAAPVAAPRAPQAALAPAVRSRAAAPAPSTDTARQPLPPSGAAHRPVTHTQAAAPAAAAAAAVPSGDRGCPEAVAALGLCSPAPTARGESK